jgi:hypothetical protein
LVLRSPLHGLLSRRTALITVTGRRSGREFTFPVGYEQRGDGVCITVGSPEHKRWWRNLRTPALPCACGCRAWSDPVTRSRAPTSAPGSPSTSRSIARGLSEEISDEFLAGGRVQIAAESV